jgi:antitoxin component HigA of HigAB toxin-antitoxin module
LAHSVVGFDVFFKSVSRQIYNPLIPNSVAMNDNKIDLNVIVINESGDANPNGQITDGSGTDLGTNGEPFQKQQLDGVGLFQQEAFTAANSNKKVSSLRTAQNEINLNANAQVDNDITALNNELNEIKEYNKGLATVPRNTNENPENLGVDGLIAGNQQQSLFDDPQQKLTDLNNKISSKTDNTLALQKQRALNLVKQKRNELVRSFIADVTNTVGLKRIVPDNVYETSTLPDNLLNQLASDVGLTSTDELVNILTNN